MSDYREEAKLDQRIMLHELLLEILKLPRHEWESWGMEPALDKEKLHNYIWARHIVELFDKKLSEIK